MDLNKAFKEDSYYSGRFEQMLAKAQIATENLHKADTQNNFSMTGNFFSFINGTSENWQKTSGGFQARAKSFISYGEATRTVTWDEGDIENGTIVCETGR